MWLLIVPLLILFVLFLTAISLVGGVVWMLGAGWPWLLIGLGIWMFWHEDGRHRRYRRHAPQPVPHATRAEPLKSQKFDSKKAAPTQPLRPTELPIDVQVRVEQIKRKVEVLLAQADRFPPFSQDLYLVRQTAADYLPRTIDTYLAMSREAAERPVGVAGKTAHQELKAQLDLLDSKLDAIAQDLQRQDTDRLLANRKFLEDRFEMRDKNGPKLGPDAAAGVA